MKNKKPIGVLVEMPCSICKTNMVILKTGKLEDWLTYKCPKCKHVYSEKPLS